MRNRVIKSVVLAALTLAGVACSVPEDPATARSNAAGRRVFFEQPKNGDTIKTLSTFRFGNQQVTIAPVPPGELTPEQVSEIWLATQREALGDGVDLPEGTGYAIYWAYIPHFIHVPFYVYAYAFGDCLVNSLYAAYQQAEAGFAEKYLDMLRAGGTKRHKELLAPFGLNAADPAFWSKGLGVISGFIDELEKMG